MNNSNAYQISLWAKKNRRFAILTIIIAKLGIAAIAFVLGIVAWTARLEMPQLPMAYLLFVAALIGIFTYPARKQAASLGHKTFYRRQKNMDGILVAVGFFSFFLLGNMSPSWSSQPQSLPAISIIIPTAASSLEKPVGERRPAMNKGGKLRQWFIQKTKSKIARLVHKIERKNKDNTAVAFIFVTLLSLALALGLGYLVFAFSCQLACAGQEALAILVLIGGLVGIIALVVLLFNAVLPKNYGKKKKASPEQPQPPIDG